VWKDATKLFTTKKNLSAVARQRSNWRKKTKEAMDRSELKSNSKKNKDISNTSYT
jgi:hypothetical protein